MAEALAAVGLAASVLQFIDVGNRFVSSAYKIYRSGQDRTSELPNLQKLTQDVENVMRRLQSSASSSVGVHGDESGLQELVVSCKSAASDLLTTLHKIHGINKGRKRDAFLAAFKMIWKDEELKSMQPKLDGFKQELVLHLLTSIR